MTNGHAAIPAPTAAMMPVKPPMINHLRPNALSASLFKFLSYPFSCFALRLRIDRQVIAITDCELATDCFESDTLEPTAILF
jgi:hypothetical protein